MLGLAAAGACRSEASRTLPQTGAVARSASPDAAAVEQARVDTSAEDAALLAMLDAEFVGAGSFARAVLYTWTTRDQVDELRRDRVLLTRTHSPTRGPAYFDRVMEARSAQGDPLATILRTPRFQRARFAWSSPWATLRGWDGESYGTELIRVTLRPEAVIAMYSTAADRWAFVDARGAAVDVAEVVQHPDRIGAVYFVNDAGAPTWGRGTQGDLDTAPYREYVLCNETMIERFEVGTDAVREALERSRALVRALRAWAARPSTPEPSDPFTFVRTSVLSWRDPAPAPMIDRRYAQALAFPNNRYLPMAPVLSALQTELEAVALSGPAFTHNPSRTPPPMAVATPTPPPPPVRRPAASGPPPRFRGTF